MQRKRQLGLPLRCKLSWPERETYLIEQVDLGPSNDAASS
jgi:hypothetical protein